MGRATCACVSAAAWLVIGACAAPMAAAFEPLLGVDRPEDLVAVPGTDWVMVSGMAGGAGEVGGLYAVHVAEHRAVRVFPTEAVSARWDRERYADCPGPPDPAQAGPHGINLRARADGGYTFYAVNHGGREAIEVFDLAFGDTGPSATWIGCAELPEGDFTNGVVPLPADAGEPEPGFMLTSMFDPRDEAGAFERMSRGEPTGRLLTWRPGEGWEAFGDHRFSGPNGVEISADRRWVTVAVWPLRKIVRLPFDGEGEVRRVGVGFMPDNLRWDDDGRLLVTGQDVSPMQLVACARGVGECLPGLTVVAIDVDTMQAETLYRSDATDFAMPTTALRVGSGELWVGTWLGEAIARVRLPH